MNEVRVYDSSGKLKEVISEEALTIRGEKKLEFPYLFLKNKGNVKQRAKSSEHKRKIKIPNL